MLFVGTSGFSYDDWKGRFYPPSLSKQRMFDFYSRRFNAVEINSTFYHIYSPGMMRSLVARAEGRVKFAAKMSAVVTHERILNEAVKLTYCRGIDPAADAGVLAAVLLQFPFRFHFEPANQRYLDEVLRAFAMFPLVVEIRHRSWQSAAATRYFRDGGINLCMMDMPRLRGLPEDSKESFGTIAYVRFHGRNEAQWFKGDYPGAAYDYHYSREELDAWVEPIREMEKKAETTLVFFNNHYQAQAPHNAHTLLAMMGETPVRAGYADLFTGSY